MIPSAHDPRLPPRGECRPEPAAVRPLVALLRQLIELVERLTDEEYACKPVGVVESSVGGHVRHNLDHVEALLRGLRSGGVCYDHRDRGTGVERSRAAATEATRRLERELVAFPWARVPPRLQVTTLVAPDLPSIATETTPERELAFVVSHTVHHNALIAVMVKLLGGSVPAEFGYAPSTIVHNRSRPCAQ